MLFSEELQARHGNVFRFSKEDELCLTTLIDVDLGKILTDLPVNTQVDKLEEICRLYKRVSGKSMPSAISPVN